MLTLGNREATILEYVIRDFIDTASPVSSVRVRSRARLDLSPASIRNTMAELDERGYLEQPHTSGGRVPTDQAYRYFVDNLIDNRAPRKEPKENDFEELLQSAAEKFGMFTVVARSRSDWQSVGIDAVFDEPEFHDYEVTQAFAEVLEDLGNIAEKYFDIGSEEPAVHIGRENVFEEFENFSSIFSAVKRRGKSTVIFSIGPKRRDYENAISIINYVNRFIP